MPRGVRGPSSCKRALRTPTPEAEGSQAGAPSCRNHCVLSKREPAGYPHPGGTLPRAGCGTGWMYEPDWASPNLHLSKNHRRLSNTHFLRETSPTQVRGGELSCGPSLGVGLSLFGWLCCREGKPPLWEGTSGRPDASGPGSNSCAGVAHAPAQSKKADCVSLRFICISIGASGVP